MIIRIKYKNGKSEFIKADYILIDKDRIAYQQAGNSHNGIIIFTPEMLKVVVDIGGAYMPIKVFSTEEEEEMT